MILVSSISTNHSRVFESLDARFRCAVEKVERRDLSCFQTTLAIHAEIDMGQKSHTANGVWDARFLLGLKVYIDFSFRA